MSNGCSNTDNNGRRLLTSGVWNDASTLIVEGGQGMHFQVSNANVLGTLITISSQSGDTLSTLILPLGSADFVFAEFGDEPMGWTFDISTDSDAFIVTWCLYSTWIPGDPPNPPVSPSITSIYPASGSEGTEVSITGAGFTGVTDVGFGQTGAFIQSASETEIIAIAPSGSGTVDVTVITPNGTSYITPDDQFTYTPIVTGIFPSSGVEGDNTVTITGTGFADVTDVGFGQTGALIQGVSDTEILVIVPPGSGTVDVTVITSAGSSSVSPDDEFTYI